MPLGKRCCIIPHLAQHIDDMNHEHNMGHMMKHMTPIVQKRFKQKQTFGEQKQTVVYNDKPDSCVEA